MTAVNAPMNPGAKENPMAIADAATKPTQIRLKRRSPAYWRVTIDNPPINVMGPEMVRQFQERHRRYRGRRACEGGGLRQRG